LCYNILDTKCQMSHEAKDRVKRPGRGITVDPLGPTIIFSYTFTRGLSRLVHADLHWQHIPERVQYKLGITVHWCQQHKTPQYLTDCVTSASDIASRQWLRSASCHQLLPRYQLGSLGRRSFTVAGPTTWNSLSADLRDPTSFRRLLKTFLFAKY